MIRHWNKGFSLLELMAVVGILGILMAVALPQYNEYMRKGARAAAKAHLMEIANRQRQYLIDARGYAGTVTALKMTTPTEVSESYAVAIDTTAPAGVTGPFFAATASPLADGKLAGDPTIAIRSDGKRTFGTESW